MARPSTSPTALVDDAERRLGSDEDPVAVVRDLARRPRFAVESAYAVARRAHRERVADVLELGLRERQRGGATGGSRWYHRAEVFLLPHSIVLLNPILGVMRDPEPLAVGFLAAIVVAVVAFALWFARAMRKSAGQLSFAAGRAEATVARRANALAERALRDLPADAAERERALRGEAGECDDRFARFQAAASLGAAEKVVAATPIPGRRPALEALDAARRAVLADLDATAGRPT